jgi:hypothetical protein
MPRFNTTRGWTSQQRAEQAAEFVQSRLPLEAVLTIPASDKAICCLRRLYRNRRRLRQRNRMRLWAHAALLQHGRCRLTSTCSTADCISPIPAHDSLESRSSCLSPVSRLPHTLPPGRRRKSKEYRIPSRISRPYRARSTRPGSNHGYSHAH